MTLEFAPLVGGWLLVLAVAASAVVLWLMWRGTRDMGPAPQRALLLGLRGLVVVAVLLALAGPVLTWDPSDAEERVLAIVVDTSRSMGVADGTNGTSRLEQARSLGRRLAEECEDDFTAILYACDATLRPLDDGARAEGGATNLRRSFEGLRADAAVLLSDGIETGARAGAPPGMPVHAVGLGTDLSGTNNLGLARVEFPESLDIGTKGRVEVEVVASGSARFLAGAKQVPVLLKENGVERTVATLDLARGGRKTVRFDVEPAAEGYAHYEIALPTLEGEATRLDNVRQALVDVSRPDFRVLYYSSRLDQEFRSIRREAAQMAGVSFASAIEIAPGRFSIQGERAGDGLARGLPADPARLRRFHAVVLGAFPAAALPAAKHAALHTYVEQGGGLVWLAADDGFGRGGWNASPLAACSPVTFGAKDQPIIRQPQIVRIPPAAALHPLARGLAPALDKALAVEGIYRFGATLPGSEVILAAPGPLPVIACRDVGKGRVVVMAASTWYRWRAAAPNACTTLWRQVLRYAASRDEARARFSLKADRGRYDAGATAVVTARVRNADLEPVTSAAVGGSLLAPDGSRLGEVTFQPSAGEAGTYTARVPLAGAGVVRLAASATDRSGLLGQREVLLRVGGEREGERVVRDSDYLRTLAETTGGRLYEASDIEALVETLKAPRKAAHSTVTRSLVFDGPWGFLLLFLLAACDWGVRRRLKLIGLLLVLALPAQADEIELSDGTVVRGSVHFTKDRKLRLHAEKERKTYRIDPADCASIEMRVVKESMERPYTFKNPGDPTRTYGEGLHPLRNLACRIVRRDGRVHKGALISTVVYVRPPGAEEAVRYKIVRQQKGEVGQTLQDLVFVKAVRFDPRDQPFKSATIKGRIDAPHELEEVAAYHRQTRRVYRGRCNQNSYEITGLPAGTYDLFARTSNEFLHPYGKADGIEDVQRSTMMAADFFEVREVCALAGTPKAAQALVLKHREGKTSNEKGLAGAKLWRFEIWLWHRLETEWRLDRRLYLFRGTRAEDEVARAPRKLASLGGLRVEEGRTLNHGTH